MPNTHEQKFTNALRDIFVGASIEGDSGYINLMRIKSRYYSEGVFPRLMEKISEELAPFPAFREELFDKLYSFFKRYFSESGSIYFRHTPYYQDIFERIYTDDRDVMLFWKTQNLYYVKTDRLFRSLTLVLDDAPDQKYLFDASAVAKQSFSFDASTLQNKRNNEKRSLIFEYAGLGENETLKFAVNYSQGATKTKVADILKAIKHDGVRVNEEQLTRAFRLFERQSEVDFFINKNAKAFLNEQFDLWMYQYLFKNDETVWKEKRLHEMQALKRVAYAIIEFIAQFEDELVRIWNKPKFALASNYVITFDKVFERSEETAGKLLAHEGITAQIEEWKQLGIIEDDFTVEKIFEVEAKNGELFAENSDNSGLSTLDSRLRFLPFDTKHFKSLEIEILGLFDNLDEELDGRLIHSENYQALNTLKEKFREKVKCIYIDPPYNTGSDEFIYKDEYRHAAWLSMMENRVNVAKYLMSKDSSFLVSVDYVENTKLRFLLGSIFEEGFRNEMVVSRVKKNIQEYEHARAINWGHNYLLMFGMPDSTINPPSRVEAKAERWHAFDAPGVRSTMEYEILGTKPPNGRHWMYEEQKAIQMLNNSQIRKSPRGTIQYLIPASDKTLLDTNWTDLIESGSQWNFTNGEKNISLIERIVKMFNQKDVFLDFFGGSGTTAHAVINLNREDEGKRKYILVEANDYFHTVILPRVKKVVFSDKWKDGKAKADGTGVSHFCKYFALEQYEDTLRRAIYLNDSETETPSFFDNPYETPFSSYVFLRDKKMSDALKVDYENNKISVDFEKLYAEIDLAETLSCVKGKFIKSVMESSVTFTDGETINYNDLDYRDILPLIWWDK